MPVKAALSAVLAAALLTGCRSSFKTGPEPASTTFTNPAPSLMPTTESTVPPTVGKIQ